MTRAVYRGYWQGGKRSARVTRLHIIRDTPVAAHRSAYRPFHEPSAMQTWCGQSAQPHRNSEPVVFDPMPAKPPEGLKWCPQCIGHLAEQLGLLDEVAARLARPEPVLRRHADHDPSLICRPAFGYGLCEVLPDGVDVRPWREVLAGEERNDEEAGR